MQVFASDMDEGRNARIIYTIISGNTHNAFVIDPPNTGIVKTNVILDREILDSYRLEVEAVDRGNKPLTSTCIMRIQIIDENDNAPFFPSYRDVKVREGGCFMDLLSKYSHCIFMKKNFIKLFYKLPMFK